MVTLVLFKQHLPHAYLILFLLKLGVGSIQPVGDVTEPDHLYELIDWLEQGEYDNHRVCIHLRG